MTSRPLAKKAYFSVWIALLALLLLTWGLANFDLSPFNAAIALTIACTKTALVLLYFMQVRTSSRLTWLIVAAGFVWLLILFDLTLSDYLTRGPGWVQ